MRGIKKFLFFAALLPLALLTRANSGNNHDRNKSEPVLTGNVHDACTKKPVPGVTVSICNSKGQDKKEVTTDASGNFKVPQMPVGEVVIVLEKKGYKTFRREGVIIKEGVSLKISFDIINMREEDEGDIFHPFRRIIEE